jgi:hypothetical protein
MAYVSGASSQCGLGCQYPLVGCNGLKYKVIAGFVSILVLLVEGKT